METIVTDVSLEVARMRTRVRTNADRNIDYLHQVDAKSKTIPNGFIKKIVWDKEGGYPEQAWGYVQYTARPYMQGFGCDGTTDNNIHLIGLELSKISGIDYLSAYLEAYNDRDNADISAWLSSLLADETIRKETIIPTQANLHTWSWALNDLYQINNRSLVQTLEEKLRPSFPKIDEWFEYCLSRKPLRNYK